MISARRAPDVNQIKIKNYRVMEENYATMDIKISYNQGKKLSYAQKNFLILEKFYNEDNIILKIRGKRIDFRK